MGFLKRLFGIGKGKKVVPMQRDPVTAAHRDAQIKRLIDQINVERGQQAKPPQKPEKPK